jgi:monothiol glutaredoxin
VEVVDRIKDTIGSDPVVLFMKGTPDFPQCGFSAQAVAALRACGTEFSAVNIFEDPELREALKSFSNWPTYPQLYVGGNLPSCWSRGTLPDAAAYLFWTAV